MTTHTLSSRAANNPDFAPVAILFESQRISDLFLDLLASRDIPGEVVTSSAALDTDVRIITEPQFFPTLTPAQQGRCLVVGQKDQLPEQSTARLSQPLTEEKIERALRQLLAL